MAHIEASSPKNGIWKIQSGASQNTQALRLISETHIHKLSWTASSKAGLQAVYFLYSALVDDPHGIVLWSKNGSFASGSLCLRDTGKFIQKKIPLLYKIKLGLWHLISPSHLLSQKVWDKIMPQKNVGYILTIATGSSEIKSEENNSITSGKQLLEALEAEFKRSGAIESWVDTEKKNQRAVEFYLKHGYKIRAQFMGQILLQKIL